MPDEKDPPRYPPSTFPEHIRHIACPNCGVNTAVVAATHYSELMYFCPACEHVWDGLTNLD